MATRQQFCLQCETFREVEQVREGFYRCLTCDTVNSVQQAMRALMAVPLAETRIVISAEAIEAAATERAQFVNGAWVTEVRDAGGNWVLLDRRAAENGDRIYECVNCGALSDESFCQFCNDPDLPMDDEVAAPPVTSKVLRGGSLTHRVVDELLLASSWFEVEPLPYDWYRVSYHPDRESVVRKGIRK